MFDFIKKVYMIGVGGISMSALAEILYNRGIKIYASDIQINKQIEKLIEKNIIIFKKGIANDFVIKSDAIIYTSAVDLNNKDLILANKLHKKIYSRAEILGLLSKDKKTIAVAGSHGKTTATGIISQMMLSANINPNIHIGGILKNISSNVNVSSEEVFITEACEYKDSFLALSSYISIILNIKPDHLDYFKNIDNIFDSFQKFVDNTKEYVIINNDDVLAKDLKVKIKKLSFAINSDADFRAVNVKEYTSGKYSFNIEFKNDILGEIYLPCYGYHNIYNALSAVVVGKIINLDFNLIKKGIENFKGIERRFEIIKENKFVTIIHDYAHHPDEIKEVLKLCKTLNTSKLIAIFQPHTYSRVKDLYQEFLSCFDKADEIWLLPIYPAREKPIKDISSLKLKKDLIKQGKNVKYFKNFQVCRQNILENSHNNTTFIIMGAGDIVNLAYSFY